MLKHNQKALFLGIYLTIPLWIVFLYDGNTALYKGEQINLDLDILILKSKFVKFLVVCLDLIVCYFIYNYLEKKFLRFKQKSNKE